MLYLRLALIVVRVCIQINDTVLVLVEGKRTGAQRFARYRTHLGKIALFKTELVVLVIIHGLVAVVMKGSNRNAQLIDHVRGYFACHDTHAVIAGLLDPFDMVCGSTCLNTHCCKIIYVSRDQVSQRRACCLSFHCRKAPAVLVADCQEKCLRIRAFRKLEAPACRCGYNVCCAVVLCHVVNDLLRELHATVVYRCPERRLLLFCPQGEICVVLARCRKQGRQGSHTASVLLHTYDGLAVDRRRAVICGVCVYIQGKDRVVDVHRRAVGELQVVADGHVVVHRTVFVLSHHDVGRAVVGIVRSVVRTGLTFDTVHDHCALSVRACQKHLCHLHDVLILRTCREERGEFPFKMVRCRHQCVGRTCCSAVACACCALICCRAFGRTGCVCRRTAAAACQRTCHHGSGE